MEAMKASRGGSSKPEEKPALNLDKAVSGSPVESNSRGLSAPAVESARDKFFAAYGGLDATSSQSESKDASKQKDAKSSRFMAFLPTQEEPRIKTEPSTPAAVPPPYVPSTQPTSQMDADKEAFQMLIQKLQRSGGPLGAAMQASGPPPQSMSKLFEPAVPPMEIQHKSAVTSPEPFQQYGGDRREDPRFRPPQHPHDMVLPHRMQPSAQHPMPLPEQALQELVAQRHPMPGQSQNHGRVTQNSPGLNSNTEFLMRLMQSHRDAPEPPRTEQLMVRMPQPTKQISLANIPDREQDYARNPVQRQVRGQQPPPGFREEQFHPQQPSEVVDPRPQPTQILQRPPPPGLDHHMLPFQMGGNGVGAQMAPPQRPMIPPPGLPRNVNVPMPGMFPPNFPPPNFPPPPDSMGPPQRGMPPPPGFPSFGPPAFMPPPGMPGVFPGSAILNVPGGYEGGVPPPPLPYDRRGMMPPTGPYRGP